MHKPTEAERVADPLSNDISSLAYALSQQGKTYSIRVGLTEEAKKEDITQSLEQYGRIDRNPKWSRFVTIIPHDIDSVRRLEQDYYDDKLAGIGSLELSPPEGASLCDKLKYF